MRKIIQICENMVGWSALCNDGTVWYKANDKDFKKMQDIPQDGYKDEKDQSPEELKHSNDFRAELINLMQAQMEVFKEQFEKVNELANIAADDNKALRAEIKAYKDDTGMSCETCGKPISEDDQASGNYTSDNDGVNFHNTEACDWTRSDDAKNQVNDD